MWHYSQRARYGKFDGLLGPKLPQSVQIRLSGLSDEAS